MAKKSFVNNLNDVMNEMNNDVSMDIAMSQIEVDEQVVSRHIFGHEKMDDMDREMSQIVVEGDSQYNGSVNLFHNLGHGMLNEMDGPTSQTGTEGYGHCFVDSDGNYDYDVSDEVDESMSETETDLQEEHGSESDIPPEILAQYEKAIGEVMPKKSLKRYIQAYDVFRKWQESNGTSSFDEKVLMAYFSVAGEKYAPSTLWSIYSMLKKTFIWKHNIDIAKYSQLLAWLKRNSEGCESKQSNVFEPEDISRFVVEAPNEKYLAMKAVLAFGIIGVSRGEELTQLTVDSVKDKGEEIIVKIPTTKTKVPKMYVIDGEFNKVIREYMELRPRNAPTNRLFLQYRNGKCTCQVMGKNSIAKIPKEIAKFLQMPDPDSYTGHSYRRTGTTIAADAGATIEELKRMGDWGDWKSTSVCLKYVQNSVGHKRKLGKMISGAINLPSTSATGSTSGSNKLPITSINACSSSAASASNVSRMSQMPNTGSYPVSRTTTSNNDIWSVTASGSFSQTMNSVGYNAPDNKHNVVFHFGGECSKFTIINMK